MWLDWVSTIGAWLLFAGPIYQAMLELRAHEVATQHLWPREKLPSTGVSPWWWLVPPIKVFLEKRRGDAVRIAFMASLPHETVASLVDYMNRATGWLLVAAGAFLFALRETVELFEHREVASWIRVVTGFAIAGLSIVFVLSRFQSITRLLTSHHSADERQTPPQ